jgi:catechol 2,3-dioxygenase-like lactoylglutathione lyase family enzyme
VTIVLDHVLVPTRDKMEAARFFAEMFGLEIGSESAGSPPGRFAVVRVGATTLDFDDVEVFEPHHYAFAVSDAEFDATVARVQDAGLTFSADPLHRRVGEFNGWNGGRGVYFRDPNGHNLEMLTRA